MAARPQHTASAISYTNSSKKLTFPSKLPKMRQEKTTCSNVPEVLQWVINQDSKVKAQYLTPEREKTRPKPMRYHQWKESQKMKWSSMAVACFRQVFLPRTLEGIFWNLCIPRVHWQCHVFLKKEIKINSILIRSCRFFYMSSYSSSITHKILQLLTLWILQSQVLQTTRGYQYKIWWTEGKKSKKE